MKDAKTSHIIYIYGNASVGLWAGSGKHAFGLHPPTTVAVHMELQINVCSVGHETHSRAPNGDIEAVDDVSKEHLRRFETVFINVAGSVEDDNDIH